MKRLFDITISLFAIILSSPILIPTIIAIWFQDFSSPFYFANRVGKDNKQFKMIKLRSMIVNAEKSGVDSTSANDDRITKIGKIVRKFKLDELPQFWNVLLGQMTIVGPRPNVKRETDLYTNLERQILFFTPGITDIASIVFSDEAEILAPHNDPDIAYNQLIRPRKSQLILFYINNRNFLFDIKIIFLTAVAIFDKKLALKLLVRSLRKINNSEKIIDIVRRDKPLTPCPPPGSKQIVVNRDK